MSWSVLSALTNIHWMLKQQNLFGTVLEIGSHRQRSRYQQGQGTSKRLVRALSCYGYPPSGRFLTWQRAFPGVTPLLIRSLTPIIRASLLWLQQILNISQRAQYKHNHSERANTWFWEDMYIQSITTSLQEMFKEVLQGEEKWFRSEAWEGRIFCRNK